MRTLSACCAIAGKQNEFEHTFGNKFIDRKEIPKTNCLNRDHTIEVMEGVATH
jgi:hypothetical protein